MDLQNNTQWAFFTGVIVGGLAALCGVRIYNDNREKISLEAKLEELTPNPNRDR